MIPLIGRLPSDKLWAYVLPLLPRIALVRKSFSIHIKADRKFKEPTENHICGERRAGDGEVEQDCY